MNKKPKKNPNMRSILDFLDDTSPIPANTPQSKETKHLIINGELWEIVAEGTWTVPDPK
jgi:hypothetical protein